MQGSCAASSASEAHIFHEARMGSNPMEEEVKQDVQRRTRVRQDVGRLEMLEMKLALISYILVDPVGEERDIRGKRCIQQQRSRRGGCQAHHSGKGPCVGGGVQVAAQQFSVLGAQEHCCREEALGCFYARHPILSKVWVGVHPFGWIPDHAAAGQRNQVSMWERACRSLRVFFHFAVESI